ncbi:uncharacterized protein LOC110197290 [Phascolarctos cinereus]
MASLGHTRAHSHSRARSPARPSSGQAPPARRGRLRRTWERRPDGRPAGSPRGAVRALCREPGGEGLRTAVHVWTAGRLETRTMGSGAEPEAIGQQPRTEVGIGAGVGGVWGSAGRVLKLIRVKAVESGRGPRAAWINRPPEPSVRSGAHWAFYGRSVSFSEWGHHRVSQSLRPLWVPL